jgi:hypothetical protein
MEITQDSLVKRSPADQNRIARLEAKLDQLSELVSRNNEDNQRAAIRSADTNGRIASHFEDSKRVLDVVNAQGERLIAIEKAIVEINAKNQNLNEFVGGVRKAAWIGVTCGGILLWWILQRYLEHGAPLK